MNEYEKCWAGIESNIGKSCIYCPYFNICVNLRGEMQK